MSNDHIHPTILAALKPFIPSEAKVKEIFGVKNPFVDIQLDADKATRKEAQLQNTLEASHVNRAPNL
jgi:hypothetical protein